MDRATREREWLELVADLLTAPLTGLPEARITEQLQVTMRMAAALQRLLCGLDRQVTVLGRGFDGATRDVAESPNLTPRELAVLAQLADGLTAVAIGRRLMIRERTVHKHLERIYAKLGVRDRLGAVLRAQRLGLLPSR